VVVYTEATRRYKASLPATDPVVAQRVQQDVAQVQAMAHPDS
jgi:hypothetical protein